MSVRHPWLSTELEVKFRLVYGPDRANSYFEAAGLKPSSPR